MSDKYTLLSNKLTLLQVLLLIVLWLFINHPVQAQVYKCENDAGEINFSDEPCVKGETSSRLNWLNSAASPNKKRKSKAATQEQKTARKARKNNQAYVLLSLLTTTKLELETASLRSSYEGETTQAPELILPDGITVDLLKVDHMNISSQYGKTGLKVHFVMSDGYEEIKILKSPYPVISGEAKIGRFSKSLQDIKRIEFFNSKKLLKARGDKVIKTSAARKKQAPAKKQSASAKKDIPVIELDLSEPRADKKSTANLPQVKPEIRVVERKTTSSKNKQGGAPGVEVSFVNDKKITLESKTLASSKGKLKSPAQHFIVSENYQIPFNTIKRIKVRPTANKSNLIVAIELASKEIKMEVMSPPFTRLNGNSQSGRFDHSLLEIKSISFQQ